MILEPEIRRRLARALSGSANLDNFEDWLVQHSWNMHLDSSRSAQELVSAIELAFAEHSSDHISDQELRRQLLSLLGNVDSQPHFSSSSSRSLYRELEL